MLGKLSARLLADWTAFLPDLPRPASLRYLGVAGSAEGGTATFLAFGPAGRRPICVVKVHRHADGRERAPAERDLLDALATCGPDVAGAVPRALFADAIDGTWVLVQSFLEGRPLPVPRARSGAPDWPAIARDLDQVADWLAHLATQTRTTCPDGVAALVRAKRAAIADFASVFDPPRRERDWLDRLADRLPGLARAGVSIQHGDLCRENILRAPGQPPPLRVIDWTDGARHGLPLHDLCFLLATYCLQIQSAPGLAGRLTAFEAAFFGPAEPGRVVADCLARHCARLGLPAGDIPFHLSLGLVDQALHEHRKARRAAERGALPLARLHPAGAEGADPLREPPWRHYLRVVAEWAPGLTGGPSG